MSSRTPNVSVILPTYNRADILGESIRSVLEQTYEQLELIVVDDASTDDTPRVVRNVPDDRVVYLRHDRNKGAPAARNTGLAEARGEYVAFQDSDDEWFPRKLERQMRAFERASADVGVVYTGMLRAEQGETRRLPYLGVAQPRGDIRPSLARQNFIPTQAALVRRECFDAVGTFDADVWPLEDWELWIRLSEQFQFELVDDVLAAAEVRPDSISTDSRAKVEARERIVNKHRSFFDEASLSRQLFYVGHGFMKLGEARKGRAYLRQAVRVKPDPTWIGALLLSFLGSGAYCGLLRRYKRSLPGHAGQPS